MRTPYFLILFWALTAVFPARADEGMWLLPLIEQLNMQDMHDKGLQLTAEQIYSINHTSLKDAVVIFGGGCTGELISSSGLLLTNHHCGYSYIQQHSSVEHDYLQDGFWAQTTADEIPSPGLFVSFLESITDVSDRFIPALDSLTTEKEKQAKIREITAKITLEGKQGVHRVATVQSFFHGNAYYKVVYITYPDVRLAGAPPSSIGKFGADTDNWMWPRHTGDFSLFRIYADKDGNPASYSPDNVPYIPKHYFPISLAGVQPDDFAMVMGYPGSTSRYYTSWQVDERMNVSNAARIKIRGVLQEIMMEDMQTDPKVRIQYASKYAGSSNYWKNSIGMNKALKQLHIVDRKRAQEAVFTKWVNADPQRIQRYGEALDLIRRAVEGREQAQRALINLNECLTRGAEIIGFAQRLTAYYNRLKSDRKSAQDSTYIAQFPLTIMPRFASFYKDYNAPTDRKVSAAMFELYTELEPQSANALFSSVNRKALFPFIKKKYKDDFGKFTDDLFRRSFFTDSTAFKAWLNNPNAKARLKALENDPVFALALAISKEAGALRNEIAPYNEQAAKGARLYMAGLMEMNPDKAFYPDANFTMRLTYGQVKSYRPADGVTNHYLTTLKGVMEKENPDNWEFVVPEKLKELYLRGDFGEYGMNGEMPVNFIFNGDITGGNSGSPALNARGELIGTAFDGNWEAMSGDIAFEPDLQRCINVDIRYVLFIIDKFAGATHLIDEMTIVR
ncbi:MAG: S46 family peptidase [Prevotellaceae bacterium]|jgi:hypothetical protein|nr:S46 family peptidase [Prevotellaceae bacterium]